MRLARGPKGEIVKLEHDVCGRVIKRTVERNGFRPQTWTFAWNALDQMVSCVTPDGIEWRYSYDPFGRRIAKECAGSRTEFVWDGDVLALERCDGVGTEWFFEPDSFRPLAKRVSGTLTYIVTDHLGTPKEMITEAGQLVWAVDHDTWGTVRKVRAGFSADAPEINAVGISDFADNAARQLEEENEIYACPIRFQGQWEDAETGLYYNRFRYYEPGVGQYLCSDPWGLGGGETPYLYVKTTASEIDPFGLSRCQCCTGTTAGGMERVSDEWRSRYGPASLRDHHLIPQAMLNDQAFVNRLAQLGYNDPQAFIDQHIARIPNVEHANLHAGGYNKGWRDWLRQNPNFTRSSLEDNVQNMMREYNIPRSSRNMVRAYGRNTGC